MNSRTFLASLTGAIATSLISTLPVNALSVSNIGGNITNQADTSFTLTVNGSSAPSTVSLNIASLTSSSDGLSNLFVYLRSPSNSSTLLLFNNLANGLSFSNVTFNDAGSETIGSAASYDNGTFLPLTAVDDNALIANIDNFSGFTVADGDWTVLISSFNTTGTDSIGTITLNIDPTPVPFEFNPTIGLVGLAAVWAFNQTRKKK